MLLMQCFFLDRKVCHLATCSIQECLDFNTNVVTQSTLSPFGREMTRNKNDSGYRILWHGVYLTVARESVAVIVINVNSQSGQHYISIYYTDHWFIFVRAHTFKREACHILRSFEREKTGLQSKEQHKNIFFSYSAIDTRNVFWTLSNYSCAKSMRFSQIELNSSQIWAIYIKTINPCKYNALVLVTHDNGK